MCVCLSEGRSLNSLNSMEFLRGRYTCLDARMRICVCVCLSAVPGNDFGGCKKVNS